MNKKKKFTFLSYGASLCLSIGLSITLDGFIQTGIMIILFGLVLLIEMQFMIVTKKHKK
jgi:hypothetical protein